MSDEEAFLASMGGEDYSAQDIEAVDNDEEDEDDYDPSSFQPDDNPSQSATPQISTPAFQPPAQSGLSVSQAPSRTASRMSNNISAPAQKPTTIGGFITEDSDDEDGDEQQETMTSGAVNVANIKSPSLAPPGSVSQTPIPANSQVYNPPAPETSAPFVATNGTDNTVIPSDPSVSTAPILNQGNVVEAASSHTMNAISQSTSSLATSLPKARLPQDVVGQFEDRISDDPKGDIDAWQGLIGHLRSKGKFDEVRKVYTRFFDVFPAAADQWIAYAQMEQELDDLPKLEAIFSSALMKVQSIPLWSIYLDHVRRRNDIATDTSGQGRQTVSQAYEFVLNQVGHDKDSGRIWQDYIAFIKAGPGTAGGTGWQDAQKMDLLRKAYQRAICVPMEAVSSLWKEYDQFEMGLNKTSGRKYLQEKSPSYMTARSSFTAVSNIAIGLKRGGIPRLPPLPGCEGDEEYRQQIDIWQKWISWEKEDPLVLKDEDLKAFQQRVLFVYKQATMALRFWSQIWYDAAEWCFDNNLEAEGREFLADGTAAIPESCLLAFRQADHLEQTTLVEEGEDGLKRKGDTVRKSHDVVLAALYALHKKVSAREPVAIARVEEDFAAMEPNSREGSMEPEEVDEDRDEHNSFNKPLSRKAQKDRQILMIQHGTKTHLKLISRTLTFVWIALMRTMRRIQGKGAPGGKLGGMRAIFAEARKMGRLQSDLYSASALAEHHCYKDPAALKIFERGIKLFPDDEVFAMDYIKHLISCGDVTNARSVFETTVSKITSKPEDIPRAKLLYLFFHNWESMYGELAQLASIEKRMAELYPEDPSLTRFARRFASSSLNAPVFDPCAVRLIISPTQVKPKLLFPQQAVIPTVEPVHPMPAAIGYTQSPKRPLDDSDAEQPARKMIRGESPLKGAAGRRQQQRQAREGLASVAVATGPAPPRPLPPAIFALLSTIPPARQWTGTRFDGQKMVELVQTVDLTRAIPPGGSNGGYGYGYGR